MEGGWVGAVVLGGWDGTDGWGGKKGKEKDREIMELEQEQEQEQDSGMTAGFQPQVLGWAFRLLEGHHRACVRACARRLV